MRRVNLFRFSNLWKTIQVASKRGFLTEDMSKIRIEKSSPFEVDVLISYNDTTFFSRGVTWSQEMSLLCNLLSVNLLKIEKTSEDEM